jgi:hypothetical protein
MRFAPVLLALALAACGQEREEDSPAPRTAAARTATPPPEPTPVPSPQYSQARGCFPIGGELRFCRGKRGYGQVRGVRVRRPKGLGGWVWAAASPDGRNVVMQWSGECEVPRAYLAPAGGGRPRPLAGDQNSFALGWTDDARAIVYVPEIAGCGASRRHGLFLISPEGRRTRAGELPVRPSVRPRPAAGLRGE